MRYLVPSVPHTLFSRPKLHFCCVDVLNEWRNCTLIRIRRKKIIHCNHQCHPGTDDDDENDVNDDCETVIGNDLKAKIKSCSYAAICDFLQTNNLLSVIRAHEAQDQG